MSDIEQQQHAIRRSTRLPLEIPVQVSSVDSSIGFSAICQTTLVNAHGCGLIAPAALPPGIHVRIEIASAKRFTTAQTVAMVSLGGNPESWLLGIEFDNPGNFWGIEYAPSDWKIEESDALEQHSVPAEKPSAATAKGSSPRWRLTDISVGACYLETMAPFQVDTPVLVSVRVAGREYLMEGLVRASHMGVGMGVEFQVSSPDHEERIGKLIQDLMDHRDVPRILVGRQERSREIAAKHEFRAIESEMPDPLLDLIRNGDSLPAGQFQEDLRAQRLGNRREPRMELALPLQLSATDVNGRPLDQRVMAFNISHRGAGLRGVHGALQKGDRVFLSRGGRKEEFSVAWIGAPSGPRADQIGVVAIGDSASLWQDVLRASGQTSQVN
jgi:hypothetical protein